uniref:Retrovirus-related Pol polyprotein from transposon TNT 1-94 n=1 Tax=Angiostrongylus cantonensis TaxID=6313 RepID=A0A158PAK4_ANGCA
MKRSNWDLHEAKVEDISKAILKDREVEFVGKQCLVLGICMISENEYHRHLHIDQMTAFYPRTISRETSFSERSRRKVSVPAIISTFAYTLDVCLDAIASVSRFVIGTNEMCPPPNFNPLKAAAFLFIDHPRCTMRMIRVITLTVTLLTYFYDVKVYILGKLKLEEGAALSESNCGSPEAWHKPSWNSRTYVECPEPKPPISTSPPEAEIEPNNQKVRYLFGMLAQIPKFQWSHIALLYFKPAVFSYSRLSTISSRLKYAGFRTTTQNLEKTSAKNSIREAVSKMEWRRYGQVLSEAVSNQFYILQSDILDVLHGEIERLATVTLVTDRNESIRLECSLELKDFVNRTQVLQYSFLIPGLFTSHIPCFKVAFV